MQFISAYPFIESIAQLTLTCEFVLVFMLALLVPAFVLGSRVTRGRLNSLSNSTATCASQVVFHSTRFTEKNIMSDKRNKFRRSKRYGGQGFRTPKKAVIQQMIALEVMAKPVAFTLPPVSIAIFVVALLATVFGNTASEALVGLAMLPTSPIAEMVRAIFGSKINAITGLNLIQTCDGLWKSSTSDKAIYLVENFISKGSGATSLAEGVFEVQGEDGEMHIIVNDRAVVTDEVLELIFGKIVNFNSADEVELMTLHGIGPAKAKDIVASRPDAGYKNLADVKAKGVPLKSSFAEDNKSRFSFKKAKPAIFLSAEQLADKNEKMVEHLVSRAQVGQEYAQMPVLEAIVSLGNNIKFVPKEEGSNFRGRAYIDQILAENPTWDPSMNAVVFVEESKGLKDALVEELRKAEEASEGEEASKARQAVIDAREAFEADGSDENQKAVVDAEDACKALIEGLTATPLNDQYNEMINSFSWLHNEKSGSPFLFAATDNGFCLVHSVLADLYTKFASGHVNATQYLKVITGTVLKPSFVTAAIVGDFKANGEKVGTDGMSIINADVLAERQIKRGVGIQFRALSANVVKAIQEADFTEYCSAFQTIFNLEQSGMEMFLKGFELPEVKFNFENLNVQKIELPGMKPKSQKGIIASAKEHLKSMDLYDAVKAKYDVAKEGKGKKAAAKLFNRMIVEAFELCFKADFLDFKGQTDCNGLFAKGAATPAFDIDQTLASAVGQNVGFTPDIIIPVANFKALGKEFLTGAKKMMKDDGTYVLIVDMHLAPISIKNGGNMRITPHVTEAAGTAEVAILTEHSVFTYCEAYSALVADGTFTPDIDAVQAAVDAIGDERKITFEYEGAIRLEPWALAMFATAETIEAFMEEEYSVHGMKDSSFALVDPIQRSDALISLSKKMTDQMIGGPKRQACFFGQMTMADFIPYGTVVVPDRIAKRAHEIGAVCKQPIQSNANHQRVRIVGYSEYASELFQLGLITKDSNGNWAGMKDHNTIFVNCEYAEDEGYADDDGDDLCVIYIDKHDPKLFQIANVLVGPVKSKFMAINAAELSAMAKNSPEKEKGWRASKGSGSFSYKYIGGSFIGLFVNQQSLFKALGVNIALPVGLIDFAQWKEHLSMALQFFAEYEGQNELDDAKKTKIMVLFMLVACCMQKRYHVDMLRSGWTGKSELSEAEFKASQIDMKFIRKVENSIDEGSLTALLEGWETKILNGEDWESHTLDLASGELKLNDFGKAYMNGQTKVTVFNPMKYPAESSFWADRGGEAGFEMNMLWMPRAVWEQVYGDTIQYLKAFKGIWLPGGTTQHSWVSYFRTGWRFLSQDSLAGKKVLVKVDGKAEWVYVPSPLLPASDAQGEFIPYFQPQRARNVNIRGFANVIVEGWAYEGDKTINAMKHEQWLLAAWRKWETVSGIPMFKNQVANGEIQFVTPLEAMLKVSNIKKHNGSYQLPWYYVTGQTTIDMLLDGDQVAPATRSAVHTNLFGLDGEMTAGHFFELMCNWFKGFGLDPETAKADDGSSFTTDKIKFLLEEVKSGSKSNLFAGTQFWNEFNRDDSKEVKGAKSLKAALFFNAVAHAGLTYEQFDVLFKAIGDMDKFNAGKKNRAENIRVDDEGTMPAIIRICKYDMLELVSIQAPDCEFTLALNEVSWDKFKAHKTQEVAIKAHTLHEHFMGQKLQDCPACRAKLKLELKRLGRGEATKVMKANTEVAAKWLNYVVLAYNKPLLFVSDKDLDSVKAGKGLFPVDLETSVLAEFYSSFETQYKSFHWVEGANGNLKIAPLRKRDHDVVVNSSLKGKGCSVLYPAGFDISAWIKSSKNLQDATNTHGSGFMETAPIFERKVEKVRVEFKKGAWRMSVKPNQAVWEFVPLAPLNFFAPEVEETQPEPPKPNGTKINIGDPIVEDSAANAAAPSEEQPGVALSYAGIGSREAKLNKEAMDKLSAIGKFLAEQGYTLRSGGAPGADSAFEAGCDLAGGSKEIYLPWKGFEGNTSDLFGHCEKAAEIARKYHPQGVGLSEKNMKFMGRNSYQVLGGDLNSPVDFIVCWTPGAKETGGTSQAMRIAKDLGIAIFNVADEAQLEALRDLFKADSEPVHIPNVEDESLHYGDDFVDHTPIFDELPFDDNGGDYEVVENQAIPSDAESDSLVVDTDDLSEEESSEGYNFPDEDSGFNSAFMLPGARIPKDLLEEVSVEPNTVTGKVETVVSSEPSAEVQTSFIEACPGWVLHPEEASVGDKIYPCVGRRVKPCQVTEDGETWTVYPFMVDGQRQLLEIISAEEASQA